MRLLIFNFNIILIPVILFLGVEANFAQGLNNGSEPSFQYSADTISRTIKPKRNGKDYDHDFIPIKHFYFVQFGVYLDHVDSNRIKSPGISDEVWLIHHKHTKIEGKKKAGAYYIVMPHSSEKIAKAEVKSLRKKGISCWYNKELTGANFTLVATNQR